MRSLLRRLRLRFAVVVVCDSIRIRFGWKKKWWW